jgi:hypothetical protein
VENKKAMEKEKEKKRSRKKKRSGNTKQALRHW